MAHVATIHHVSTTRLCQSCRNCTSVVGSLHDFSNKLVTRSPPPISSSSPAGTMLRAAASRARAAAPRHLLHKLLSNIPEAAVYGGPKPQNPNQRFTLTHLRQKHLRGEPITVVTAYDYPSAVHVDTAGFDICLVGDSAAMVIHGHDTTLPISLDEMLVHCRSVARGATRPLLIGDLPFGSYESSTSQVNSEIRDNSGGNDLVYFYF